MKLCGTDYSEISKDIDSYKERLLIIEVFVDQRRVGNFERNLFGEFPSLCYLVRGCDRL